MEREQGERRRGEVENDKCTEQILIDISHLSSKSCTYHSDTFETGKELVKSEMSHT